MSNSLTFAQLAELEPKLTALLDEAKSIQASGDKFCANAHWFASQGLRQRLKERVGPERQSGRKSLRSGHAYATAAPEIYHALPDCQHSSGWCLSPSEGSGWRWGWWHAQDEFSELEEK